MIASHRLNKCSPDRAKAESGSARQGAKWRHPGPASRLTAARIPLWLHPGYRTAQVSGTLNNRTVIAAIQPQPEDAGQVRNLYAWAVAPDGTQYMQTDENQWQLMNEPMPPPAKTVTVPADGSPVTLPVIAGADLSSLVGTLVYVGMGASWTEVKSLNKAGHIWTVQ